MSTQKTLIWSVMGMEGTDMNGKSDIGSNGCPNYELLLNHRREVCGGRFYLISIVLYATISDHYSGTLPRPREIIP